jgi:hypothetical protein
MHQLQFFVGVVLSGFFALGCETESQSASETSYYGGPPQEVRVVAPDGRVLFGSQAGVTVFPSIPNVQPDEFQFVVSAAAATADPAGRFQVGFSKPAELIPNPELIEVPIQPRPGVGGSTMAAIAANEDGPIASGSLHLELRAGRMTGRVDTPDGTYQITGKFAIQCMKPEGDHGVVDERLETPLCKRFASLQTHVGRLSK